MLFCISCSSNVVAQCLTDYSFYKQITIQSSQVPSNQNNFPVLIQHTDPDLKHISFSGDVESINGFDIIFTSSDGTTLLDHQIESYNPSSGKITMWVKLPVLSSSVDTDIYLYYGNNSIASDPSTNSVWDNDFEAVYHFESIATMGTDATSNSVSLTNSGVNNFVGIADEAASFETGDALTGNTGTGASESGSLTISTWVNLHSLQGANFDNVLASCGAPGELLLGNFLYSLSIDPDWKLRVFWEYLIGLDVTETSSVPITPSLATWTQLSVVRNSSSNNVKFYQDGVQLGATVSYSLDPTGGGDSYLHLGESKLNSSYDLDGELDEFRMSSAIRSEDWLRTEFNSISSPATFYSLGAESPTSDALSYNSSSFCIHDSDFLPTIIGLTGGSYSSTTGLSINSTTGLVDLSSSTPAIYSVSYNSPNNCISTYGLTVTLGPQISCRPNDTVVADLSCNYILGNYTSDVLNSVIDGCLTGSTVISQNPTSGTILSAGSYIIELTLEDGMGNTDVCTFDLIIKSATDTKVINCGDDLIGESTIAFGNTINDFSCAAFSTPGEEKFYQIDVPIGNYQLIFSLDNVVDNNFYTELFWLGSNCTNGGNCIEQRQYDNVAQQFQGGGSFVNFFASGPATYYLAIDSQGDGVSSYDISFDCISSGIQLDNSGCLNDSDNDGVVNWIDGTISNNLTNCQSATFCQDIYVSNDNNSEWLDSVSIKLDSCYLNVSNFTTSHATGQYETGNWIPTYSPIDNQISWQFNNTNITTFGDGYTLAGGYDCAGGNTHLYTFCFDAEISKTCSNSEDLDIIVYVSDDGVGLGVNDLPGADQTKINFNLTTIPVPTFSYPSEMACSSGSYSPTVSPSGGSFSSTAGLSINSSSGVIDLSSSIPGVYIITYYEPTNCKFNTFNLTIGDNVAPTMVCQDINLYLDGSGNGSITASALDNGSTDNCGAVTFSASKTTFSCSDLGGNSVTLTGTDGNANSATCISTVTVIDTISPVSNLATLTPLTSECTLTAVAPTANDNCSGLVTATTTDPTTFNTQGTFTINWTYDDGNGNTTTQSQTVTIDDVTNPVMSCGGNITENPNATCQFTLLDYTNNGSFTDNCGGVPTITQSPVVGTVITGNTTITLTGNDGNGNTATCTFDVILSDNLAPTMVCQDINLYLDGSGNGSITASALDNGSTDNCGALTFSASKTTFSCSDLGGNSVTLTGTDGNANSATCISTVTVIDTISPVPNLATLTPLTSECTLTAVAPTANDNCSGLVTATTTDPTTFNTQGTFTINWTYDDGNGNTTTQSQTVVIDDVTNPSPNTSLLPDLTDNCSVGIPISPTATDNCDGQIVGVTTAVFPIVDQGVTTVTWTFTDANGNAITQDQNVIINDTVSPEIICSNDTTFYISESSCMVGNLNLVLPTISDNCGNVLLTTDTLTEYIVGNQIINWTVTDDVGNDSVCQQLITIIDTILPTINCPLDTVVCDSIANFNLPIVSDNCGINSLTQILGASNGQILAIGDNTMRFQVTDINGNVDSCEFIITRSAHVNASWQLLDTILCIGAEIVDLTLQESISGIGDFEGDGIASGVFSPLTAGVGVHEIVYSITNGACITKDTNEIIIIDYPSNWAGTDIEVCDTTTQLSADASPNAFWTSLSTNIEFEDVNSETSIVSSSNFGTFSLVWHSDTTIGCSQKDTVNIRFDEIPSNSIAGNDTIIYNGSEFELNANIPDVGNGEWIILSGESILSDEFSNESILISNNLGENTLIWTVTNGVCPANEDEISVVFMNILIPQGISPNSDGLNDYLYIEGIEQFKQRELIIFDRWGTIIYSVSNYENDWDGISTSGEYVNHGTYFYNLTLEGQTFDGFVVLKK